MKQRPILISLFLLSFALSGFCISQNVQIYQHPACNFNVKAFDDWVAFPHPEDNLIYEIRDPESVLRVLMWYTETEDTESEYLKRIAEQKKLVYDAEPIKGNIKERNAWFIDGTCCMKESPVRVVLIAIPLDEESNVLYVAQVVCPENKLEKKEASMEKIIYSLDIAR